MAKFIRYNDFLINLDSVKYITTAWSEFPEPPHAVTKISFEGNREILLNCPFEEFIQYIERIKCSQNIFD